jgi:hypothetical protein
MKYHKEIRTWTNFSDKRPKLKKMDVKFGTWNIRNLYLAGSLMAVEVDFREIGWGGMDWIDLTQDRDKWRPLANTGINTRVP